ncbi:MAG: hypothetical protein ACC628_09180 [Pirellulaceae bacterium]
MKHISVDNQSEDVKHFLLSLDLDSTGSILELDGKQLLRVSPVKSDPLDSDDLASVQRGIEQMGAGEGRPFIEVDSDIREKLGFPQRQ